MKRILIIMHSMPVGGAERVLIDTLNCIDYTHYQVDLLLRNKEGGLLSEVNNNVKVFSLYGKVKRTLFSRILYRMKMILSLNDYLERRRTLQLVKSHYDCIISFCQGPAHKLHQYLLGHSINHVSWVHSDLKKGNWGITSFKNNLLLQEDAYNRMNQIVFVSEGAKRSFNELFHIQDNVIQPVVYNIVDRENIVRLAASEKINKPIDKFVFVNVGRLVEAKNQHLLLQASKKLKEKFREFEVWILGEGPLRRDLEKTIEDYDLKDYVKLLGNKSNPYSYVQVAGAFVSSSRQEGFSMVLCEAVSLCKPVISTDIVGPREVLDNGKFGIMVDETPEALSGAMYDMATDKKLLDRYTNLSTQRAKDFSTDDFMESFYSIVDNDYKF